MIKLNKPHAKLENWSVAVYYDRTDYRPLEFVKSRKNSVLFGTVTDHPYVKDDREVYTSIIVRFDLDNNIIETNNTIYHLGKMDAKYSDYLNKVN